MTGDGGIGNMYLRFDKPVDAAEFDVSAFVNNIDSGVDPAVQLDATTIRFAIGDSNVSSPFTIAPAFDTNAIVQPTSGTTDQALPVVVGATHLVANCVDVTFSFGVSGHAIDRTKVKVDGVAATATAIAVGNLIRFTNPAWPADTSGHTLTCLSGFVAGCLLPPAITIAA